MDDRVVLIIVTGERALADKPRPVGYIHSVSRETLKTVILTWSKRSPEKGESSSTILTLVEEKVGLIVLSCQDTYQQC